MATAEETDIVELVQNGLHALVLGFGYKIGIVDVICQLNVPCSAEEISDKGNFRLRYVQEWLGCMVASGILKVRDDKYWYPMEKQVFHWQAFLASSIHVLSNSTDDLEKAVQQTEDGPTGYTYPKGGLQWVDKFKTPKFQSNWMETDIKPVMELFKSFDSTVQVLDLGCGHGRGTMEIAKRFPQCNIIGIDMVESSIDAAKKTLLENDDVKNLHFMLENGENLPLEWNDKFDCILLMDALHDMVDVDRILSEMKRVLKPGGYAAAFDPPIHSKHIDNAQNPVAKFYMPYSLFFCLPQSMSRDPAIGFGSGWGYENRKKRIENIGFRVIKVGELGIECCQERIVFQKMH